MGELKGEQTGRTACTNILTTIPLIACFPVLELLLFFLEEPFFLVGISCSEADIQKKKLPPYHQYSSMLYQLDFLPGQPLL